MRATSRTRHAAAEGESDVVQPLRLRSNQHLCQPPRIEDFRSGFLAGFKRAQRLHQRFFEGAANGHHFADRLHLRTEVFIRSGEFFKLPLRNLGHDIIDGRLEAGRGHFA